MQKFLLWFLFNSMATPPENEITIRLWYNFLYNFFYIPFWGKKKFVACACFVFFLFVHFIFYPGVNVDVPITMHTEKTFGTVKWGKIWCSETKMKTDHKWNQIKSNQINLSIIVTYSHFIHFYLVMFGWYLNSWYFVGLWISLHICYWRVSCRHFINLSFAPIFELYSFELPHFMMYYAVIFILSIV